MDISTSQDNDVDSEVDTEAYLLDDQIGYILRLANQRHAAIFQAHNAIGLTATQFAVVVRLSEVGECSQNRLGRRTAMDVATVKGVVDRLHRKGFVMMRPDENDKRRTIISLSDMAIKALTELRAAGREVSNETLKPLRASEQRSLLRLLRKLS